MSYVNLSGSRIGDAELACFADLPDVEVLDLSDTNVTDAGLAHLKGLTAMQMLILDGTRVTQDGIKMLRRALPRITILHQARDSF